MKKKILVCGVPNSDNLGDKVIAESMKFILNKVDEGYKIENFDITDGRAISKANAEPILLNSNSLYKKVIPNFMRRLKVQRNYKRNSILITEVEEEVRNSDLIIIGGGHLLIDNYLSFPIGIYNIVKEAKKNNIPVSIAFVGAKGPWSYFAKKKFLEVLNYAKHISVRDSDSKEFLTSINKELEEKVIILSDPALFVDEIEKSKKKVNSRKHIGLGVMDPNEMLRHSNVKWDRDEAAKWWITLTKKLFENNFEVSIFTNGAKTDNAFVENYLKKNLQKYENVNFIEYPKNYKELLKTISNFEIVIAQRLHACLPSISYKNITYGIKWDRKLENIFKDLFLDNYLINCDDDIDELFEKITNNMEVSKDLEESIKVGKKEMQNFVEKIVK